MLYAVVISNDNMLDYIRRAGSDEKRVLYKLLCRVDFCPFASMINGLKMYN
jgi:hypothetical protein